MASVTTRCFLQATGDYYLCPLGGTQIKAEAMQAYLEPVAQGTVEPREIHYDYADGHSALIAKGYEQNQTRTGEWNGQTWTWSERQLVVYSLTCPKLKLWVGAWLREARGAVNAEANITGCRCQGVAIVWCVLVLRDLLRQ
jgi:hypothetical protein